MRDAHGGRTVWIPLGITIAFLVHPAWTISALNGDCGCAKRDYSIYLTAGCYLLVVVWTLIALRGRTTREENLPLHEKSSKFPPAPR